MELSQCGPLTCLSQLLRCSVIEEESLILLLIGKEGMMSQKYWETHSQCVPVHREGEALLGLVSSLLGLLRLSLMLSILFCHLNLVKV